MTLERAFDIVGAAAGPLVFAPVMAIVIPAVLIAWSFAVNVLGKTRVHRSWDQRV